MTTAADPVQAVEGPGALSDAVGDEGTKTMGELLSGYARTLAELRRRGVVCSLRRRFQHIGLRVRTGRPASG